MAIKSDFNIGQSCSTRPTKHKPIFSLPTFVLDEAIRFCIFNDFLHFVESHPVPHCGHAALEVVDRYFSAPIFV